jgi:putative cell wall-binding protein
LILVAMAVWVATLAIAAGGAVGATGPDIVVLGGSAAVSDSVAAQLGSCTTGSVTRLSGSNRYATAAAISASTFSPGVLVVAIATGENFPDALAGGAAAGDVGGPVLLVTKDGIPGATVKELKRLNPKEIIVLGGTSAVSTNVETALKQYTSGPVNRISGSNRYATAAATSAATFLPKTNTAWVSIGTNFPDALGAGPAAIQDGGPVLLVQRDSIPDSVRTELTRLKLGTIKVVGGTGVVSAAVEAELGSYASESVTRFAGSNRYATAAAVSAGQFGPGLDVIVVATGENFPDALAGGPAAGAHQAPLLLVQKNSLPADTATEIARLTGKVCGSVPSTTAEDILEGRVPVGDAVLMRGEATRRIDQDDYEFTDGTGNIRIDIRDDLNQDIPLNTCMILSGFWDGREVEVVDYAACTATTTDQ